MKNIRFTNSLTRPLLAERPVTMWVPQGYICIYDIVLCCPYWVIMHLDENKWYVLFWALCWDLSLFMIYPLCGWRDSAWQKCGYYLTKTAIKMLFWTGAANNNMLLYSEKSSIKLIETGNRLAPVSDIDHICYECYPIKATRGNYW